MMPRHRRRTPDVIEQDFMDAVDRLKANLPVHPKNRELLKKRGSVPISISSVAREAGRARGLIAGADSRYQRVRNLILAESGEVGVEPGNRNDVIADLRAQVAELRGEVRHAREHAAYHLKMRAEAENRLDELRGRYDRLSRRVNGSSTRDTVVSLIPKNKT